MLGLCEVPKPRELEGRGGVWFGLGGGQLHLGVEEPGPESRRHVALETDDLEGVRARLLASGARLEDAVPLAGIERFYCRDPFGNKLEILGRESGRRQG